MDELLLRRRALMSADHDFSTPGWDGRVWAYFNVTDTSSATTLLYRNTDVSNVEVDGIDIGTNTLYTFSESGEHLVKVRLSTATTIPSTLFYNVTTLTEAYIPEGVTTISSNNSPAAFRGCKNLKKIHFPTTLTFVGLNSFYGDTALTGLYVKDIDKFVTTMTYSNAGASPTYYTPNIYVNDVLLTSYTFPEVTTVRDFIFYKATSIRNITLPPTITTIGNSSFTNLSNTNFNITSSSIKSIADGGVYNCRHFTGDFILTQTTLGETAICRSGITSISLPNIITIGSKNDTGGFYWCENLKTIDIGENCTKIWGRSFNSISQLEKIIIRATTPPEYSYAKYPWYNMPSTMKIYVPYSSDHSILNTYKNTQYWSTVASQIYELTENGQIPIT